MAGLDEDLLLDLLASFYDAALAPAEWPRALERLSDALGGVPVHFGVQRLPTGMPWIASVRRDPVYHRIFQERFAPPRTNPVIEAAAAMRVGGLYQRRQFWDDAAYHASEIRHEIVRPQGQDDFALAMLARAADFVVPFTIYRRIGSGPFTDDEAAFLARLLPHLSRCLQVQLRLETAEAQGRELVATLDHLPLAVVLLGADAQLVRANAAADALLRAGDGLAVRGGRIAATSRRAAERLHRLIASASATGAGQGDHPGGGMALPRRPPARSLSILVSPLPEGGMRDRGVGAAAVMLVRDPDRQQPVSEAQLAELYGLTAAEARTAAMLVSGDGPGRIAARLGIGLATVRTHLHRIFDKTGAGRQAELVRLLMALAPPGG